MFFTGILISLLVIKVCSFNDNSYDKFNMKTCVGKRYEYFENILDCRKFFYCGHNETAIPSEGLCPPGLWFDHLYQENGNIICNNPKNITCASSRTCACTKLEGGFNKSIRITCNNDKKFYFIRDELDCKSYYICHMNDIIKLSCKQGLYWNQLKKICDNDVLTSSYCHQRATELQCPEHGEDFFPHPDRCDQFFYCIEGELRLQSCPFYYYWNEHSKECLKIEDDNVCKGKNRL